MDGSSPYIHTPCLVCKFRKVRCDRTRPECQACKSRAIKCSGYEHEHDGMPQKEVGERAQALLKASNHKYRGRGSCHSCRQSKVRCSRTSPACARCLRKQIRCTYNTKKPKSSDSQVYMVERRLLPRLVETPANPLVPSKVSPNSLGYPDYSWAYHHSLPADPTLQLNILTAFFDRVYPLRCMSFIHRTQFMDAFEGGTLVDEFGEALVHIVYAMGAWAMCAEQNIPETSNTGSPGEAWAARARSQALENLNKPDMRSLMVLVLSCQYYLSSGANSLTYVLLGMCYNFIQVLGLDTCKGSDKYPADPIHRENSYRLVWCCYTLDSVVGAGVEANLAWGLGYPDIPLPLNDLELLSSSAHQENLRQDSMDAMATAQGIRHASLQSQAVYIIYLRTLSLSFIRQSNEVAEVDQPNSSFKPLISQLEFWHTNLPPSFNAKNLDYYVDQEPNNAAAFFSLHVCYHAAMFDLARITLPGFKFPASSQFAHATRETKQHWQEHARSHASKASSFIQKGLDSGCKTIFDDRLCNGIAFEAIKIQIVHSATAKSTDLSYRTKTEENIRSTLAFMATFPQGVTEKQRDVLLSLLTTFGFHDVLRRCWETNPIICATNHDPEIVGPRDVNLPMPLAPFHKAISEVKENRKKSQKSPETVPANDETGRVCGSKTDVRLEFHATNEAADRTDGPQSLEDPITESRPQEPISSDVMDPYSSMDLSFDDYIRLAGELSEFITDEINLRPR